ncbi:AMP-binding protein [Spiractinospora alimapuensis]|uniref:AMP-binding protein n=1 Tax=Spiractinospora alimapuensis TaxID=2820884 RepID=UPI001F474F13|nr:AMP-binding protein [Spiractinospora alimapuensis]QVQ53272.1 AMP-binding protein [Spiractinospora alimapuensis]
MPHLHPTSHVDTFTRDNLPPDPQWPELLFDHPDLRYPDQMNCVEELLDGTIERHGADRPCLLSPDGSWTYGELAERVNRIAHVLVDELGVRPGNRVLLRGPNSPWLAACWLAVLRVGAVVVTVVPVLRSGELVTILRAAEVSHAICEERFRADLDEAIDEIAQDPSGRSVSVLPYGGDSPYDLSRRAERHDTVFPAVRVSADDACMIAYTSGTTGVPKGCVHFHRDVLAVADTFSQHVLRPQPSDVFAGSPPFAFTFGLGGLLIFPMRAGASTLLLEKAGPKELLRGVHERGVSVLFTAPTAYRAMLADLADHDLASLRRCVSAGEHLPAATWEAWREATGIRIIDGIGATEMLHIFISAADDDIRPGATGRPVPGFVAAVLDADGNPVPDGEPGLLAVRGPVGCRYLADPRQERYVRHGWNYTGDTYVRDSDGYLWYQSRSDDMIISAGYNIAPAEVEEALLTAPEVAETAVVGVPDERRGAVVAAFVVPAAGTDAGPDLAEKLRDHVKARITPYKAPRVVEFVSELPRTVTGKLQRFKLRNTE